MAIHRRFVLNFNALTSIVLVLLPVCCMGQSTNDNSDTISASSSGFGYELLRSQLDEMQASIAQLQQATERRNECAGLEANIATILNRLETIENGLKASEDAASPRGSAMEGPVPPRGSTSLQSSSIVEERRQRIISNARYLSNQAQEVLRSRVRDMATPRNEFQQSVYDRVYDSCEDVPSTGVWKIREGIQITNVYCNKF